MVAVIASMALVEGRARAADPELHLARGRAAPRTGSRPAPSAGTATVPAGAACARWSASRSSPARGPASAAHVAHGLLEAGYRVVLAGRRAEALEETRAGDERATVVARRRHRPRVGAGAVRAALDRLDVLFNNAGTFGPVGADRGPRASRTGRRSSTSNLTGAFLCAQAAFRRDEGAGPARRADHQQRLDLRPRAAPATRSPTPPPSTRSPASPRRSRSRAARTTSPAGRSTSATPRPR